MLVHKPIRLLFVDEMRYGLISNVRRSWSAIGKRSVYQNQQEFVNRYLYSAIDPISGESFHLMDFRNTTHQETNLFLEALKDRFPNEHMLIVWDRASFHRAKSLKQKDITLISLPSYSPQLNPVERFFQEIRKFTANKIFREGIEALSKTIEKAILKLCNNLQSIRRLTAYNWILEQWQTISEEMVVKYEC